MRRRAIRTATAVALGLLLLPTLGVAAPRGSWNGGGSRAHGGHGGWGGGHRWNNWSGHGGGHGHGGHSHGGHSHGHSGCCWGWGSFAFGVGVGTVLTAPFWGYPRVYAVPAYAPYPLSGLPGLPRYPAAYPAAYPSPYVAPYAAPAYPPPPPPPPAPRPVRGAPADSGAPDSGAGVPRAWRLRTRPPRKRQRVPRRRLQLAARPSPSRATGSCASTRPVSASRSGFRPRPGLSAGRLARGPRA